MQQPGMVVSIKGRTIRFGAVVAGVGGLLAMGASLVGWVSSTCGVVTEDDITGINENAGRLALALGVLALALAIEWARGARVWWLARGVAGVGVLILFVLAIAYFSNVLTRQGLESYIRSAAEVWRMTLFRRLEEMGACHGSTGLGIGFLLEILAGFLLILGGCLGLLWEEFWEEPNEPQIDGSRRPPLDSRPLFGDVPDPDTGQS